MNRYRVYGGVAQVGIGQVLQLSGKQIRARAHLLELPEDYDLAAESPKDKPPKAADAIVTTKAVLSFKVGEIIGLPELPSNLITLLEPLDKPATSNDEKAADRALQVKNPKAHRAKRTAAARQTAAEKAAAKRAAAGK